MSLYDRRRFLHLASAGAAVLMAPYVKRARAEDKTLTWLTWPGHGDPSILAGFQEQTGYQIRVKEYGSGDLGLIEMTQNPGVYDVVTTSMEFIPQYVEAGLLEKIDPEKSPGWKEYFPEFRKDIGYNVDGEYYAVVYEFGFNGLAYRSDKITADQASSYEILLDSKIKGKIGCQDWWGNTMGSYSILAGASPAKGRNPYLINGGEFEQLKKTMRQGRPNLAGFFEIPGIFSAFANESIWLQPGGGDWAVQLLRDQGIPMASAIPREGAYLWGEAISIVKGTSKTAAAQTFVDYCLSAQAQAAFATKPSYSAIVPNQEAWKLIQSKGNWAERLNMASLTGSNALSPWRDGKIAVRLLPKDQSVEDWANAWQEFKAS